MSALWSTTERKKMSDMAAKGYTARQIATAMNKTRNAIIGFAHRNGIRLGVVCHLPSKAEKAIERRRNVEERAKSERRGPLNWNKIKVKSEVKPPRPVVENLFTPDPKKNVTFMELKGFHCRSIVGPPKGVDTIYCGQKVDLGKSWCAYHQKQYYVFPSAQEKSNGTKKNH